MNKYLLFFVTLVFSCLVAQGQRIDSMMQVYAQKVPQQKAYLHLDKSIYRAGETIWFKAYIMEGISPAASSANFYTELIDDKGKVLQQKVSPIVEASAAGSFDLPADFPASLVTLKAYTTWMLNFEPDFIYHKKISILNDKGEELPDNTADTARTTIQFFPEGGDLVSTIATTVAFKATDSRGMPVTAKGRVVDSKGKEVAAFNSVHNGMGRFTFTPSPGETYTALWTDYRGSEKSTPLPLAKPNGVTLSLSLRGDKVLFAVTRSADLPAGQQQYNLVAHFAQMPVFKSRFSLENTFVTSGMIPINSLPSGILQVTLFSQNWEPLAERITLVNNNEHLFDVTVHTPVVNKEKRKKNEIAIVVEDTFASNLSLSITDASLGYEANGDNIISRLLLTGDLRGYVHEPAYYFSNSNDTVANHLDLVMMTHGWRRFRWENLKAGRIPNFRYKPDSTLTLQAHIFGVGPHNPIPADESLLAIVEAKDSSRQFILMDRAAPDKYVAPSIFFDTARVFYQFQKNRKLENVASILFQNNFYKGSNFINPRNMPQVVPPVVLSTERIKTMADQMSKYGSNFNVKGNVLATVTVRTRAKTRNEILDEEYTSGMFKGFDGQTFDMTDAMNQASSNIFQFLQGRVAGLQISNIMGMPSLQWRGAEPTLFLNEVMVDVETLSSIPVTDVAYIKTFRPPFFGAIGGGSGGAIAVYTRKGGDQTGNTFTGLSRAKVPGYSVMKEFYSPDYSDPSASAEVSADYRSTLFWRPFIFTDKENRHIKFHFYNNDITTSFRLVLEGVNEIGKMVRIEKIIN